MHRDLRPGAYVAMMRPAKGSRREMREELCRCNLDGMRRLMAMAFHGRRSEEHQEENTDFALEVCKNKIGRFQAWEEGRVN